MTGIELLQMIKNGELKEGTKINVIKLEERVSFYDYSTVTIITFIQNNLEWPAGTFKSSMLWDNDYLFEIMEREEVPNKIEKLYHILNGDDKQGTYYKLADEMFYKINELIDTVNYLLDTQNKG